MRAIFWNPKAFAAATGLAAVLACPRPGSALTGTCSPTPTATYYPAATETSSPTATATPTATAAAPVPRGRFLFLSANVVRHIEMAPLIVRVHLPDSDSVVIKLFDAAGEELRAERAGPARDITWVWDGTAGGEAVSPGVYLVSAATSKGATDLCRFILER